jgi:hypothetical protein
LRPAARPAAALIAALAWFGLFAQYGVVAAAALARDRSLVVATISYFGFFTILTNLLIAVGLTWWVVAPRSRAGAFFGRPGTTAATALYIVIVAVVYSLLLRRLWHPTGWQKVADVLLHDLVPPAYLACWALLFAKGGLPWRTALRWLAYPAVYFAYTLMVGAWSGRYPYPFLNVARFGYPAVLRNGAVLLVVFLVLGLAFVAVDRALHRRAAGLRLRSAGPAGLPPAPDRSR